ncbi:redoxin NrdH [Leuconostocaceae bacterium ESL0723]|nr:redoxin NrdH [Lactobacillaceae bacterium L1_55_11]WEV54727.1 redoxin NrdH [Leuconostocaceae bacterium ESL0723]
MSAVTVFTKNNCIQCKMTKNFLERQGVDFQEINIDLEPKYVDELREMGYRQTPVVLASDDQSFSGFRPDELKKLTA